MYQSLLLLLANSAVPVLSRIFAALGIGVASYAALTPIFQNLTTYIYELQSQLPLLSIQILQISGVISGIKMIISAYTIKISFIAVKKIAFK